ncbi:mucin-17-like [Palaemon carinicauda]|uniref:mucin-17-like n=1 Tax=Palaemon carinicauda TaxID=392227 RepID=UPI0035B67190
MTKLMFVNSDGRRDCISELNTQEAVIIACALGYVSCVPRLAYEYDWSHRINTEDEDDTSAVNIEPQYDADNLIQTLTRVTEIVEKNTSVLEQPGGEANSGKFEGQQVEAILPVNSTAVEFNHTERYATEIEARLSTLVETISVENLTQTPFVNYSLSSISADQLIQILDSVATLSNAMNENSDEEGKSKPIKVVAITYTPFEELVPFEETGSAVSDEGVAPSVDARADMLDKGTLLGNSDVTEAISKPLPLRQVESEPLSEQNDQVNFKSSVEEDAERMISVDEDNNKEVATRETVGHGTDMSNEILFEGKSAKQLEEISAPSQEARHDGGGVLSEETNLEITTVSNNVSDFEFLENFPAGKPEKTVEETEIDETSAEISENIVDNGQEENDITRNTLSVPGVRILEIRTRDFNQANKQKNAPQDIKVKSEPVGSEEPQRKGKAVSGSRFGRNQGFSYSVVDNNSRKVFGHEASYQERTQEGSYFVHFSDGTVLLVTYIADHLGYRPNLRYFQSIGELNQFIATHPKKGYEYPETGAVRPFNRPVATTSRPIGRPFTATRRPSTRPFTVRRPSRRPFTTSRPFRRPVPVTHRPLKRPGTIFSMTTPRPSNLFVNPVRPNNFYVTPARPHYGVVTPRPGNLYATTWPSHFFPTTNKFPFWPWYPNGVGPSYPFPPKYGTPFTKFQSFTNRPFTVLPLSSNTSVEPCAVSIPEPAVTEEATTTVYPLTEESETTITPDTTDGTVEIKGTDKPPSLTSDGSDLPVTDAPVKEPVTVVGPQMDDSEGNPTESPSDLGARTTVSSGEDDGSESQTTAIPESATESSTLSSPDDSSGENVTGQADAVTEIADEEGLITTASPEQESDVTTLDPSENKDETEAVQGAKMLSAQVTKKKEADIVQILPPPSTSQAALMKSLMPKNLKFQEDEISKNSLDSTLITAVYNSTFLTPTNITPILPYGNTTPEYITITLFPRQDEEAEKTQEVFLFQYQNETSPEIDPLLDDDDSEELIPDQHLTKTEVVDDESESSLKERNSQSQRQPRRYLDSRDLVPKLVGEDRTSSESPSPSPPVLDYRNEDSQSWAARLPKFTRQSRHSSSTRIPSNRNARLYNYWRASRRGLSLPKGSLKLDPVRRRTLLGHLRRP